MTDGAPETRIRGSSPERAESSASGPSDDTLLSDRDRLAIAAIRRQLDLEFAVPDIPEPPEEFAERGQPQGGGRRVVIGAAILVACIAGAFVAAVSTRRADVAAPQRAAIPGRPPAAPQSPPPTRAETPRAIPAPQSSQDVSAGQTPDTKPLEIPATARTEPSSTETDVALPPRPATGGRRRADAATAFPAPAPQPLEAREPSELAERWSGRAQSPASAPGSAEAPAPAATPSGSAAASMPPSTSPPGAAALSPAPAAPPPIAAAPRPPAEQRPVNSAPSPTASAPSPPIAAAPRSPAEPRPITPTPSPASPSAPISAAPRAAAEPRPATPAPTPPSPDSPAAAVAPRPPADPRVTPPPSAAAPAIALAPRAAGEAPPPTGAAGLSRYRDPRGLFNIDYPAGWQLRSAALGSGSTTFYLDDPEDGIAVTVLAQGSVPGQVDAAALAPIVTRRMRERYPDFALTTVTTRTAQGGAQQTEFSARWTNRWAQPMRARGVIATAPRGADTAYSLVTGQAQELVFTALEPVFSRVLASFRSPAGS